MHSGSPSRCLHLNRSGGPMQKCFWRPKEGRERAGIHCKKGNNLIIEAII